MATPRLSALLDRFRRGVAVPAAVGDELEAELAPVFASLDVFELEANEVRRVSAREAELRLDAAREEAVRIAESWRDEAEAARSRAASERRERARAEAEEIVAAGRAEAARIRERGSKHIPALVSEIVRCVERGPR